MTSALETTRQRTSLAVDMARFFVFHPGDYGEDDAGELDPPDLAFEEGLVAGLRLGADGVRVVELCEGPLPEGERAEMTKHFVFRLHVRHGALFATERIAGRDEYDWKNEPCLRVANGRYRATLWLLGHDAPRARNLSFVLALEPVESFDGIPAWAELPHEDDAGGLAPMPQPKPERRVRHPKFGEGVVLSQEDGPTPRLLVRFADGERKLLATFVTPVE